MSAAPDRPSPLLSPFSLRGLELSNRLVISPMCQYSAEDGVVGDWHLVHLGSRAVGGAGLVMAEMTDVSPEGRITPWCAGLWNEAQAAAWKRVVDFVHRHTASRIGIQLAHAGRKASARRPWEGGGPLPVAEGGWQPIAPSAEAFDAGWPVPRAMDRDELDRILGAFVAGARRAVAAGFDLVELHMAHGYLLSSFLSPLSNHRTDGYGGDLEGRMRFPLEVLRAVREVLPETMPLAARISATDWAGEGGFTIEEAVVVARRLAEAGCDLVDVSSGGNVPSPVPPAAPGFQVPLAERIRREAGVPTVAVGQILSLDQAAAVVADGKADLVAVARLSLREPYLGLQAHEAAPGLRDPWPPQYLRGRDGPR